MQRDLIEAITDEIAAELPQFNTVELYNDQFTKQDDGVIDSFRFPALFISFPDGATYKNYTAGVQTSADVTVRFYIADQLTKSRLSISKTVLEVLDLKQTVFSKFQGFSGVGFKSFTRIFEEADESRTNYYIFTQDYQTSVIDSSSYVDQGATHSVTLDLTGEVIINPLTDAGIRTAKDVNDN
jgi:hypothetical protein